jgi:hypothetical protein
MLFTQLGLAAGAGAQQAVVTLGPSVTGGPVTGRLFVIFARTADREPRFLAGSYVGSVPFYGMDVTGWKPGTTARIGATVPGFPFDNLTQMPAGEYYVQALLNVYTQFHRADGHTVWVHADQWEGQHWATSPGNLVSDVVRVHFDPKARTAVQLVLTRTLPPIESPADTRWVKHVKIRSDRLSRFWGAPVYIGATVLLPRDFDDSSSRRYPAVYIQGHFGLGAPFGFTDIPDAQATAARRSRGVDTVWDATPTSARESGQEFATAFRASSRSRGSTRRRTTTIRTR